ncbi:MAG: sodium/proline symporter PutP [Kiritimatiellia bacterium]
MFSALFAAADVNWYTLTAFALYLLLMLGIGFLFSRKQENMGDYFLGGRKMNKWVVALSAQASDMSGWLLMGLPGALYVGGFSEAWIGVGLGIGTYLNWKIVAHRLRRYSQICGDSITIPDFISNRFRDNTGVARIVAALIILVFFTFYTASGFVSAAKLFSTMFPMSYTAALWLGAIVVVSYTLLGGYMAVCWTDFIQGTLMFVAIVLVPAVVVCNAGGFAATVDQLNAINGNLLNLFTAANTGKACGFAGLVSCLAWGLGYFGMPHILVRFMSIGNPAEVKGSRRIAMTWVFISLAAATALGLVFHLYLKQRNLTLADVGGDPEKCFMVMIGGIFNSGVLSRLFAGVLLSAIMAAIMSTADSQLLVSASSFTNDLYRRVKKNASNHELVLVSRAAVAAVAVVATAMAMNTESEFFKVVMKMVSFAWAGFGASFGPLILLALFWKRTNLAGAIAGMVTGATTCFVWKFVLAAKYASAVPLFALYELAPGFVLAFVVTVVVSLLTKRPSGEICAEFDRVGAVERI